MKKTLLPLMLLVSNLMMAQESPIKDEQLKQLIGAAVNNFPKIKELQEQTKQYSLRDDLVQDAFRPTVKGTASYAYIAPLPYFNFGGSKLNFIPHNNYNAAITVEQLIFDFGRIRMQLEKNKAAAQLTDAAIDNSKNAVAYQVTQLYYTIQFLNKAIATQQEQIDALKANEKLIQARLDNGDALRYDLLTTQVRTANATSKLEDLQSQLEKQYVLLQWLTGSNKRIAQDQRPDVLPLVVDGSDALNENGEAQVLKKQIDLLRYDIKSAALNDRPTVFAAASGGVKNGYQPNIDPLRLNGSVAVGISVPLLNGNRTKIQQQLTQVQIDATNASLNTLQSSIQKDLALNAVEYKLLQEKLKNTDVLVQQATKAFEIGNVRFRNGLMTNAELLLVQTSLEEARLQQVQLQYQIRMAQLESHRIIGRRLY